MKLRTAILGLLLLGQLGCSKDALDIFSFADDPSLTTLNGTWRVYSFENLTTGTVEYKTQENSQGKDITVTFDDTKNPHELTGTNTTNAFSGDFEYPGQRQFKMNTLSTTKIWQPAWANKFTDAILDDGASFRINSTQLRLYYANKTKSVTLNLVSK